MATELALELLFEDVVARFAAESPSTKIVFGWRQPPQQLNQGVGRANRVAFVPGVAGKAGKYVGARAPGRVPRPLRTMLETCTVYCWAVDATDAATLESDLAQWRAARLLHDGVVRACELSMRAKLNANLNEAPFSDPEWVNPERERRFGAELKFVLTLHSIIPDERYEEQPDVEAQIGAYFEDTFDGTDITVGD